MFHYLELIISLFLRIQMWQPFSTGSVTHRGFYYVVGHLFSYAGVTIQGKLYKYTVTRRDNWSECFCFWLCQSCHMRNSRKTRLPHHVNQALSASLSNPVPMAQLVIALEIKSQGVSNLIIGSQPCLKKVSGKGH